MEEKTGSKANKNNDKMHQKKHDQRYNKQNNAFPNAKTQNNMMPQPIMPSNNNYLTNFLNSQQNPNTMNAPLTMNPSVTMLPFGMMQPMLPYNNMVFPQNTMPSMGVFGNQMMYQQPQQQMMPMYQNAQQQQVMTGYQNLQMQPQQQQGMSSYQNQVPQANLTNQPIDRSFLVNYFGNPGMNQFNPNNMYQK